MIALDGRVAAWDYMSVKILQNFNSVHRQHLENSPSTFPIAVASKINSDNDLESLSHTSTHLGGDQAAVDRLVSKITKGILEVLDATASLRQTRLKSGIRPWVTRELRELMSLRDRHIEPICAASLRQRLHA
uniref:Uncharacterized protein n=1 Tax=Trichogramma kaykai TaxID=54128 RepID=A0ABD2W038_9HYME